MLFLAGLMNRSSISFILVTVLRVLSIAAILFAIAVEVYWVIINVQRFRSSASFSSTPAMSATSLAVTNSTGAVNSQADLSTCGYQNGSNIPKDLGGVLFFVLEHICNMAVLMLCFLSELSPPRIAAFFEIYFPPLGPGFGVGILGSLQVYVSCVILSHHLNKLGATAGWFLFMIGLLNIIMGFLMGQSIRSRRSVLDAGTNYVKKTTHLDDVETGLRLAQKGASMGKKFKNLRPSMISRPKVQPRSDMSAARPPLEISRPIIDFQSIPFEHDNHHLKSPQNVDIAPPVPAPPPPIYQTFNKQVKVQGSRLRPSK